MRGAVTCAKSAKKASNRDVRYLVHPLLPPPRMRHKTVTFAAWGSDPVRFADMSLT
jgi:hypothetical protein